MKKKASNPVKNILFVSVILILILGGIAGVYVMVSKVGNRQPSANYPMNTPSQVYKQYLHASREADFNKARKYISQEHQSLFDTYDEERIKNEGKYLKSAAPKQYKITSEKIEGDTAVVMLEGDAKSLIGKGNVKFGKIIFKLENGEWKISKLSWADTKKNLK